MASIKNTTSALGNILSKINNPAASPTYNGGPFNSGNYNLPSSVNIGIDDDSIPTSMLLPEPMFNINYKSLKKLCYKKAKDSIEAIIKEVVPTALLKSALIQDKSRLDYESLGNLYMSFEQGEEVLRAMINTIARGETSSRNFEVFAKLLKNQLDLSKLITDTQNQMRKYYIDTYLDLQQKDEVDANTYLLTKKEEIKAIEESNGFSENVLIGTDQTVKMIAEKKKKAMMAKYQEIKNDSSN